MDVVVQREKSRPQPQRGGSQDAKVSTTLSTGGAEFETIHQGVPPVRHG